MIKNFEAYSQWHFAILRYLVMEEWLIDRGKLCLGASFTVDSSGFTAMLLHGAGITSADYDPIW